jgi:hypothetical protein
MKHTFYVKYTSFLSLTIFEIIEQIGRYAYISLWEECRVILM